MGKIEDLSGQQFCRLTVQYRTNDKVQPNGSKRVTWHCLCECGNECDVTAFNLKQGHTKSCGCLQKNKITERFLIDLTGKKFGRWTVLYRGNSHVTPSGQSKTMWYCKCECGTERDVDAYNLMNGLTKSCGCLQKENASIDLTKRVYDNDGNLVQKLCPCCKQFVDVSLFSKNKNRPDGFNEYCNSCLKYDAKKRYDHYKSGAKGRDLCFELTLDEFKNITSQPCMYCGEFSVYINNNGISGVDRIDSTQGYTINNVIPCCEMCNRMKLHYDIHDWLNKITKIARRFEEGVICV
jgi:hypothetical protein